MLLQLQSGKEYLFNAVGITSDEKGNSIETEVQRKPFEILDEKERLAINFKGRLAASSSMRPNEILRIGAKLKACDRSKTNNEPLKVIQAEK